MKNKETHYCARCYIKGILKPAFEKHSKDLCGCCLVELQNIAWEGVGYTYGLSVKLQTQILVTVPRLTSFEIDEAKNACKGL